jgi:hypothetical protein
MLLIILCLPNYFIYFVYFAYFQSADRQVESEPVENFQDIHFEDLEHQQAGFEGKCP